MSSSPVIIESIVVHQARPVIGFMPPSPSDHFPYMPASSITVEDSVVYNDMAAFTLFGTTPLPVYNQAMNVRFENVINRYPVLQPEIAPYVVPILAIPTEGGECTANSSLVVIDHLVLYPARASFVPLPITPVVFNSPAVATATSSPVVIDHLVLYPAAARFVFFDYTEPAVFGWQQPFPEILKPSQIYPKDNNAWNILSSAVTLPPTVANWYVQFPIPSALPKTDVSQLYGFGWGVFSTTILPPTSASWYIQWPIPPATGTINIASVISGVAWNGQPITTSVLPPNVANWYVQFPIPPAKGVINVASLIDGFTWSEISTGGTKQKIFEWIIRARRRARR